MKRIIIIPIVLVIIGFIFWNSSEIFAPTIPSETSPNASPHGFMLTFGNTSINLEIADTPAKKEQGLSGRKNLGQDAGMLFVWNTDQIPTFWMKDMRFAIDIIWIDKNWRIVDITSDLKPETYPLTFSPKEPVRYVLEVNSGWAKDHHIIIGAEGTLTGYTN